MLKDLPIDSFDGLPEDMLCCVCLQPSLDNVACCTNGHNACRTCAVQLTNRCPQACGPLLANFVTNVPLNSLVRETQLKCPNVAGGCSSKVKIGDMRAHAVVCNHREVACPCAAARDGGVLGCTWKGPYADLAQHMREVDHDQYIVDVLLDHSDRFSGLERERSHAVDHLKSRFAGVEQWQSQQVERERRRDEQLAGFKRVLDKIEEHTNKRDGSSKRSIQRHNQLTTQNENLEGDVADLERRLACDAGEIETLHAQVDSLQQQVDIMREEPDVALAGVQEHLERRECAMDLLVHDGVADNKRLHEMHATMVRMLPSIATARHCPCAKCVRDAGS